MHHQRYGTDDVTATLEEIVRDLAYVERSFVHLCALWIDVKADDTPDRELVDARGACSLAAGAVAMLLNDEVVTPLREV